MSETDIVASMADEDEFILERCGPEFLKLWQGARSDLSRMREALDDARKWVIIARTYAVHREEATKALAKIDAALSPATEK